MQNRASLIFYTLTALMIFVIYWAPISTNPTLDFDDTNIISPMKSIHSLDDYQKAKEQMIILDLQPIRDFTYWLEFRLEDVTGYRNTHVTNLLLWYACLIMFYLCLRLLLFSPWASFFATALVGLHPVAVNSVAWGASRKHLLSALFILLATYSLFRIKENRKWWLAILIFYFLAVFSQPINILWPAFLIAWIFLKNEKTDWVGLFAIAAVGFYGLISNYQYYAGEAYKWHNLGSDKFINNDFNSLIIRLKVIGKYIYQIFVPINPSISYYSLLGYEPYVGIFILFALLFLLRKFLFKKENILWALFILLNFSVVNLIMTYQVGWDTYLLTPLFGLGFLFASLTSFQILRKPVSLAIAGVLILFSGLSFYASTAWTNEQTLWRRAWENDSHPFALLGLIKEYSSHPEHYAEAIELTQLLREKYPNNPELPHFVGKMIFLDPKLNDQQKTERFIKEASEKNLNNPWFIYFWAAHDASHGRFDSADERISSLMRESPPNMEWWISGQEGNFYASWFAMCSRAQKKDCKKKVFTNIQGIPDSRWNQTQFELKLISLHSLDIWRSQ